MATRLNFSHLYYFFVVAKLGSVKEAALKLHVSQPTVSDQIRLLEEYFECKLFERKNRALFLTKEGLVALDYAEKIFDIGTELTGRLKNRINLPKKTLDIGITQVMGPYFLYDTILPLFEQEEVALNFSENKRHILLAELEEGNIDMIFTDNREGITSSMASYRVGINRTFAVAHKRFKKYEKGFPRSLTHIPFFGHTPESPLKYEIDLFFSKNNITPRNVGSADDIELLQLVTKRGIAFTIMPEVAVKKIRNDDVIILGELEEFQSQVWAIVKKSYEGIGTQIFSKGG